MNNTNQNHTDNFFKQGLSSPPEVNPSDKNWGEMERRLKLESKRRPMAWIYPVSGIAAALLVVFSLWLLTEKTGTESERLEGAKESGKKAGKNIVEIESQLSRISSNKEGKFTSPKIGTTQLSKSRSSAYRTFKSNPQSLSSQSFTYSRLPITVLKSARYLNIHTSVSNKFASQRNIGKSNVPVNVINAGFDKTPDSDSQSNTHTGKWVLSLALSPDVNSVKGIDKGDFGRSVGMGVSYKVGKFLSLGTGIYYSKKLYSADKTSYKVQEKPFATWTSYSKKIDADCRVIDIPLNVSLQMTNKTENKLYVTAGLSSYIMLSEKYEFIYNRPSPAFPTGRREYTIRNQNKHILSVVNLGLALEKPLSNQVSLVIEPYAKLPLSGIGQGETNLKSFGVGIKLNYSLIE